MAAVRYNHDEVVALLLDQKGINLDAQDTVERWTSLHHAATRSYPPSIKRLIAAGADPKITNNQGQTPLDKARIKSHHECVSLLKVSMQTMVPHSLPKI